MALLHAREAEIGTGVAAGELLVIETHEMQDGGVEVTHMNRLPGGAETNIIRRAMHDAGLRTATSEP